MGAEFCWVPTPVTLTPEVPDFLHTTAASLVIFRQERMVRNYEFIRRVNFPLQTASNFQLSRLLFPFEFDLDEQTPKAKNLMFNFNKGT
jgi:hypothetical protein